MVTEEEILDVAERSVLMAGAFLRLMSMDELNIFQKDTGEVVTSFDLESERLITNEIRIHYPEHAIVAEEMSPDPSDRESKEIVWYVDPLDGTGAFLRGNIAMVTLTVAARDKDGLIAAAIYNPFTDMLYSATRKGEALLNRTPIPPTRDLPLSRARMLIDFSSAIPPKVQQKLGICDLSGDVGRIFRFDGSIAQHLCLIAQGTLDGGVFWGSGRKGNYYDIAGALLILERQGIMVTDLEGDPIVPKSIVFDQLVVALPELHEEILKWISRIRPS